MRNRLAGTVASIAAAIVVGAMWGAQARQTPPPSAITPRLPDGTVNFGRVPGEKGVWRVPYIQNMGMRVIGADGQLLPDIRQAQTGRGRGGAKSEPWIPWMPWSAALYDYNSRNSSKFDPEGYCLPPGGPRFMATPYPMEIVQLPAQRRIFMIFEGGAHIWREIYMDGRPHPTGAALNPSFLGHSVGTWEGDTLVVDVVGFNENTWLDYFGHPHTDKLHVVERFSRPNTGTLHYEATVTDPGAYTRPFTFAWDIPWDPTGELMEYICQENNQYLYHLTDDFGQPFLPASAVGQYGHPLDSVWIGEWGPTDRPNRLLLDLDWDGKAITGVINPGSNAATVRRVTVDHSDPSSWVIRLEAEGKDASGTPVPIFVDGRLENIGAYRRVLRGTWTQGREKGPFVLTRN